MRSFVRRSEVLVAVAVMGLFAVFLSIPGASLTQMLLKGTIEESRDLTITSSQWALPLATATKPSDFLTQTAEAAVMVTVSEGGDERVKKITQGILGHLKQGSFEVVGAEIQDMTMQAEGYIQLFRATFQDELWSGQIVSRVPQENYTSFVFEVKKLVSDRGRVVFAEISIEDITGEEGAEEGETMATVRVDLDEKPPGEVVDLGPFEGFLSSAAAILTQFGVFLGYAVVLIVPLSVAALGFAVMVNRGLRPLWTRTLGMFRPTSSAEE
ncbi:MAG: hypothetical protein ACE5IJ_10405 [Thermoplasmata archaeon]